MSDTDPIQDSVKTAEDVTRIGESGGASFYSDADVEEFVEEPLVDACKIFLEKGIRTYWSSANILDGHKEADIGIDYSSLSEENKAIARKLGGIMTDEDLVYRKNSPFTGVFFRLPISAKTPIPDITKWSIDIAKDFKNQICTWVPTYTLEEINSFQVNVGMPTLKVEDIYTATGLFYAPDGYIYDNEKACQYHIKHQSI